MRTPLLAAAALIVAARIASGFDVTSCDTTIPPGEFGLLQNDLSCSGAFVGVVVSHGATLDMLGHVISGSPAGGAAVVCGGRRCRVTGPGLISGPAVGVSLPRGGQRLEVRDLTIQDCGIGIHATAPKPSIAIASNVTAASCAASGFEVQKMRGTTVRAIANGGPGFAVDRLRADDVVASDNGASGIFGSTARVTGLVANNNGDAGIRVLTAALRDATLIGNNGYGLGFDILTKRRPRVSNVTCGTSGVLGGVATDTWGVCAGD